MTATYDSAMPAITVPTRTGYTFGGYFSETEGNGTQYYNANGTSARTWNIANDATLYAKWTPYPYTVKFNANGGSGTMADQAFTYDVSQNLTANAFTRTGYHFTGWNTAANGSGTAYADKASVKNLTSTYSGTVTLYAQWEANTATITIKKDNSNWSSSGMNVALYSGTTLKYAYSSATASGATVTFSAVANGTYNVYASKYNGLTTLVDTGVDITISSNKPTVVINFYSRFI